MVGPGVLTSSVTLGYDSPEIKARAICVTSLVARMGTCFTSLIPGRALILLPCSQEGHLFYFPATRKGTYFTSLSPGSPKRHQVVQAGYDPPNL